MVRGIGKFNGCPIEMTERGDFGAVKSGWYGKVRDAFGTLAINDGSVSSWLALNEDTKVVETVFAREYGRDSKGNALYKHYYLALHFDPENWRSGEYVQKIKLAGENTKTKKDHVMYEGGIKGTVEFDFENIMIDVLSKSEFFLEQFGISLAVMAKLPTLGHLFFRWFDVNKHVVLPKMEVEEVYVNLAQMKKLGWNKLHCGYKVYGTEQDSPIDDLTSVIILKHREISETDVNRINALFVKYQINTKKRICAFFAECSAETTNGNRFLEAAGTDSHPFVGVATRTNLNKWFDDYTKYGSKYRGAGAIQLTWDYHFKDFEKWIQQEFGIVDTDISNKGSEYVAMNYTWEAAVFFWSKSDLNSKADTGDIHKVTAVVNSQMSKEEYALRESAYNNWIKEYDVPL